MRQQLHKAKGLRREQSDKTRERKKVENGLHCYVGPWSCHFFYKAFAHRKGHFL